MKYSVDKIEKDIIVLENLDTLEHKEVKLPFKVKEGDIIIYKNNKYYKDDKLKQDRIKLLEEKLKRVQNIK